MRFLKIIYLPEREKDWEGWGRVEEGKTYSCPLVHFPDVCNGLDPPRTKPGDRNSVQVSLTSGKNPNT